MCGITGFVDFSGKTNQEVLDSMLKTLQRRGPDDNGQWITNTATARIGLAQNRLSIIDLSQAGHQPFHFEHLHLIYNGEIYNYLEIKTTLEKHGYHFSSHSDTEVLIKAFHYWGINAVHQFRGMFAFCLYDEKDQKIYLFRDRAGVKPLYYYRENQLLLFGSTLSPLMQHPAFKKNLSMDGLSQYLQLGYIPPPYSIFENTHKLLPGHYAVLDLKQQSFIEHPYWDITDHIPTTPASVSDLEATNTLEQLLQEAFQLRLIADVPVGCFLSGGIDSSLVTAILQKSTSTPLNTFSIGFEDTTYNEAPHAEKIAQYLGTRHTEHYCTAQDALNIIPLLPEIYDEPFADESAIPTYLVAQLAKQQVKVALSGDGGDELFGGYTTYQKTPPLLERIKRLPMKGLLNQLSHLIPDPLFLIDHLAPVYYKKYLKLKTLLEKQSDSNLHQNVSAIFTAPEITRLLGQYFPPNTVSKIPSNKALAEIMMLVDFKAYLPEDILLKVDRATMYHSLEGREPLLDHKIIEYAAALPLRLKQEKNILKTILARYIPRELFERKKQGFGLPLNHWLQTDLISLVHEYLNEDQIQKDGLFDITYIRHIKKMFFMGKANYRQLWIILMFQMWKKRYL